MSSSSPTLAKQQQGNGGSATMPTMPTMRLAGLDERRSARTPHVMDAWICSPTAVDPVDEREEVRAANISRHGVGFTIARPLATGAFWIIEIGFGDQRLVSEVRIVNCRRVEGGYEVGAEFC